MPNNFKNNRMSSRGQGRGRGQGRPRLNRRIAFNPSATFFKPQGVPMKDLEVIELSHEELEAIRLKNIEGLDQNECAQKMKTSQSTLQRILSSAYKKISQGLVEGRIIKIQDK